jgi:TolB-like protein/Tfp pilus assembly protein PilF
MSFISELKRRNVFRVAVLYGVASWVLLQVGDLLFGVLGVPPWGIRLLLGLLLLGFPLALIFAWVYELTPDGLKREAEVDPIASVTAHTARRLDLLVIVLLVAAIGLVAADRFLNHRDAAAKSSVAASQVPSPALASGTTAAAAAVSIAVLPFVNMSEDKANEYFSDGLTEELLNVLANVQGMRVIARTSSFSYKGKEVKISDVARDLNVDNVLEGSVRKSGNKVRITTQLIRASDSSHLWSETYDRDLNDIFRVQDEISGQVVDALKVRLLRADASAPEVGGTKVSAAYEAYLKGRFLKNQGEGEESLKGALAAFDESIRLDPQYAKAYVGRSDTLWRLGSNAYMPVDDAFAKARQAAQRAIELAPDLAEAYLSLSNPQAMVDFDLHAASSTAERAVRLNPGSFDVQFAYSGLLSSLGRHDEAIAAARKAVELDPVSAAAHANLAGVLAGARRYDESLAAARHAQSLEPLRPTNHTNVGYALLMTGHLDEALAEFSKESVRWQHDFGRAVTLARMGKKEQARAEMEAMQARMKDDASYQYAEISAQLGDLDQAIHWLENARRVHDPGLMSGVYVDPLLDPLRTDPRYDKLITELGFKARN